MTIHDFLYNSSKDRLANQYVEVPKIAFRCLPLPFFDERIGAITRVLGISQIAVPFILAQWFPQNAGFAAGAAMAFSGISGAICNPLCAGLIRLLGWQATILILGALTMLLTIPGLYLMFRWTPDAIQKQAPEAAAGISETRQVRIFLLLSAVLLSGGIGVQFSMNMSMYAQSIPSFGS